MGTLYVVRHGQAAFGTEDYDRLTELGTEQCRRLGHYLAAMQVPVDAIFTGSLTRHRQSMEAMVAAFDEVHPGHTEKAPREVYPALNEYDPDAVIEAFTGSPLPPDRAAAARDPHVVKKHFRLLRDALSAWATGATKPRGMPSFADFQSGAVAALVAARERYTDGTVVIVTSGGPIGAIVAHAMQSPNVTAVELNLRIRNASLSEFSSSARRHHLVMFNSVAHLEGEGGLVSYA